MYLYVISMSILHIYTTKRPLRQNLCQYFCFFFKKEIKFVNLMFIHSYI